VTATDFRREAAPAYGRRRDGSLFSGCDLLCGDWAFRPDRRKDQCFFAPFYIFAGVLLGPGVLNVVSNSEVISLLGEIGVVFLLFFLGLEFSIHTFLEQKRPILIAGSIDFAVNFSFGFALGLLLGLNVVYSLVIAGAIYMSSSGIITKSLIELQINKNREGHLVMGIMVFEDLVMILFLVLISSGLEEGAGSDVAGTLVRLLISLAFCGALLLIARKATWLMDKIVNIKKKELLLLVFFGVVLLVTSVGKYLGVSEALVAFFLASLFRPPRTSSASSIRRSRFATCSGACSSSRSAWRSGSATWRRTGRFSCTAWPLRSSGSCFPASSSRGF
jgi:predicted Kef-type K+ transport protein